MSGAVVIDRALKPLERYEKESPKMYLPKPLLGTRQHWGTSEVRRWRELVHFSTRKQISGTPHRTYWETISIHALVPALLSSSFYLICAMARLRDSSSQAPCIQGAS